MSRVAFSILIALLLCASFSSLVSVEVVAQSGVTFSADGSECASIDVVSMWYGAITYSSFPATQDVGPYKVDHLTITVTPQAGYTFAYADDGSTTYLSSPFSLDVYFGMMIRFYFTAIPATTPTPDPNATATPTPPPTGYQYIINGLYSEENAYTYLTNLTVTAYYPKGATGIGGRGVEVFTVAGSYTYQPPNKPMYFSYDLSNYYGENVTRQYWLSPTEYTGTYYATASSNSTLTPITFNIRALGGLDFDGYFLIVKSIYTEEVIEKRIIDNLGIVTMNLKGYGLYSVSVEGPNGFTYNYGYITMSSTAITLTISALSFPNDVLLQYKYLRIWASRPSGTEIMISYEDTNLNTISVVYEIFFANGTIAYTQTHTGENSFVDVWTGADADTTYYLEANVTQATFGVSTFSQVLLRDGESTSPVDLSFLGDWPVDPTQVFWALVIFIIFGCFSVLNSYIGGFAGVCSASILSWLGWIEIPVGALAAAMCVAIMAAIVYWKRRG